MSTKLFFNIILLSFLGCKAQTRKQIITPITTISSNDSVFIKVNIKSPLKNTPLQLFEPIDNFCNFEFCYPNNTYKLVKDTTILVKKKTVEPNTYIFQYGVSRIILNLFPKDTVVINLAFTSKGYTLNFAGSDSMFHRKYNEDAYKIFMDKGFDTVITKLPESSATMISKLKKYITKKTLFLDNLLLANKITKSKYEYFKKQYSYSIAAISANPISNYYRGTDYSNFDWFNQLYKTYPPFDTALYKCLYGRSYLTKYLYDVKNKRTTVYNGTYDKTWESFGIYSNAGFAPFSFQKYYWSSLLVILAKNNSTEINVTNAFNLFKAKFNNSDYNDIIESLMPKKFEVFNGVFLNSNPSTIQELWNKHFQGKAVFIDFWATWCAPCTEQFQYKKGLDAFLKSKKIELLYISMDSSRDKSKWLSAVKSFRLNASNIIVNNSLKKDIIKTIYQSEDWSIPRYILINKKGVIVSRQTLQPSDEQNLYQQISKLIEAN